MIADCGSSVPRLKPNCRRPACSRFEFSHKCARLSAEFISLRIEVAAVATTDGGSEAVNTYGRHTRRKISNFGWFDTQNPPTVPTDFEKVPMMKSTSSMTP